MAENLLCENGASMVRMCRGCAIVYSVGEIYQLTALGFGSYYVLV